eukprot:COSAG02_NODE_773_length_17343_cov_61.240373_10_plen_74_part_00
MTCVDVQATVKRINELLILRGYATWFGMLDLSERIIIAITAVVVTVISDAIVCRSDEYERIDDGRHERCDRGR